MNKKQGQAKQENSPLIYKFDVYKKEDEHMELQIFFMTLQESKEILQKEGVLPENLRDFSQLLKEVGSKAFHEKSLNFPRYDNINQLFELLKSKKQWSDPSFMKEKEENGSHQQENYSVNSSSLKLTAPAMRHDSLESHEQISESELGSNDSKE